VGVGLDGKTYTDRVAAIKALSDAMAFKGTERWPSKALSDALFPKKR